MGVVPHKQSFPLSGEEANLLHRLTQGLDPQALIWLSGYAAGLAGDRAAAKAVAPDNGVQDAPSLTVLYGSQTGNSRRWAERIHRESQSKGLRASLISLADYSPRKIAKETCIIIVISTHGDGEPPDDALEFADFLQSKRAPKLDQLNYAVLALGDSSYPLFCAAGHLLDQRLNELGASRLAELGECDMDVDAVAESWWPSALKAFGEPLQSDEAITRIATVTPLRPTHLATRDHPAVARVHVNQRISASNCGQDVRHIELSAVDGTLNHAPGDSLGVWHRNPATLVDAIIESEHLDGNQTVSRNGQTYPLRQWLAEKAEITRLSRQFFEAHAMRSGSDELNQLLAPDSRKALSHFLERRQLLDLLHGWPAAWSVEELVDTLTPIIPRLYSIASSPAALAGEIHLTVARLAYQNHGAPRFGAASTYLCETGEDDALAVHVEPNTRFRLPQDPHVDIIMVGAGTGVAPFRAFVQERVEMGASGRNWMFFGARHCHSHFLYQLEWQRHLKLGTLHHIDLAFSRDHGERVYVQNHLVERGRDVYAWLEEGAHLYVCGGIAMEKAVREALTQLVAKHGNRDRENAFAYVKALQSDKRYCKDVY